MENIKIDMNINGGLIANSATWQKDFARRPNAIYFFAHELLVFAALIFDCRVVAAHLNFLIGKENSKLKNVCV